MAPAEEGSTVTEEDPVQEDGEKPWYLEDEVVAESDVRPWTPATAEEMQFSSWGKRLFHGNIVYKKI